MFNSKLVFRISSVSRSPCVLYQHVNYHCKACKYRKVHIHVVDESWLDVANVNTWVCKEVDFHIKYRHREHRSKHVHKHIVLEHVVFWKRERSVHSQVNVVGKAQVPYYDVHEQQIRKKAFEFASVVDQSKVNKALGSILNVVMVQLERASSHEVLQRCHELNRKDIQQDWVWMFPHARHHDVGNYESSYQSCTDCASKEEHLVKALFVVDLLWGLGVNLYFDFLLKSYFTV